MKHGDLLLMNAHEYHGNTFMDCNVCNEPISGTRFHDACGTERISVVSYMRTKMTECGSQEEELRRATEWAEMKIDKHDPASMAARLVEEQAAETSG
jgi:adenosylmethionine-8-amino-7-oxononanoate aminotransferase